MARTGKRGGKAAGGKGAGAKRTAAKRVAAKRKSLTPVLPSLQAGRIAASASSHTSAPEGLHLAEMPDVDLNTSSRWDDWVPQERLRELNAENLGLAKTLKAEVTNMNKQLRAASKAEEKAKKGASSTRGSENSPAPGLAPQVASKKRGRDLETEKEDAYFSKPLFEVNLSDQLKSILVDDWENVTKNLLLARVPADIPVTTVLDEWEAYERTRRQPNSAEYDTLAETVQGFKRYFNRALGKLLLYTFERAQYRTVYLRSQRAGDDLEGKSMADLYGPEHLLRMLTQMPELAANTNIDKAQSARLKEELHRLSIFLAKPECQKRYFSTPYEAPSVSYKQSIPGKPVEEAPVHVREVYRRAKMLPGFNAQR